MATTDTHKPTDTTPSSAAVENPTKTAVDAPPLASTTTAAAKPDLSVDAPAETPAATTTPSAVDSAVNGSKPDSEGLKTAAAEDGAATAIEKKMRRAERFGITVQLTEEEKRNSRAERFGKLSTSHGSEASKTSEDLKRKARAERFGIADAPVAGDNDAKKKARLARFAPASKNAKTDPPAKTDPLEEEKRKARSLRFSNGSSGSLSKVNDKGNVEPKPAIAGAAVGGA